MRGEARRARTTAVLAALPEDQWTVLRDGQDKRHIVVGPPGVFAIDTKDWSGAITVRANELRQNGARRREVAESAENAAKAVIALGIREELVHPVVCFDRDAALTAWVHATRICSVSNLVTVLRAGTFALSADEVREVSRHLDATLRGVTAPPLPARVRSAHAVQAEEREAAPRRWWRR